MAWRATNDGKTKEAKLHLNFGKAAYTTYCGNGSGVGSHGVAFFEMLLRDLQYGVNTARLYLSNSKSRGIGESRYSHKVIERTTLSESLSKVTGKNIEVYCVPVRFLKGSYELLRQEFRKQPKELPQILSTSSVTTNSRSFTLMTFEHRSADLLFKSSNGSSLQVLTIKKGSGRTMRTYLMVDNQMVDITSTASIVCPDTPKSWRYGCAESRKGDSSEYYNLGKHSLPTAEQQIIPGVVVGHIFSSEPPMLQLSFRGMQTTYALQYTASCPECAPPRRPP